MPGIITSNLNQHFSELKSQQMSLSQNAEKNYEPKIATKGLLKSASAVVTTQGASYYHPLYEPTNLQLPTKLRECLIPETLITMEDGTRVRIDEIEMKDIVIDKNGNEGEVQDIIINEIDEDILSIKLLSIKEKLNITKNHNVFCIKKDDAHCINKGERIKFCQKDIVSHCKRFPNCVPKNIEIKKVRADELEEGDFLLSPIITKTEEVSYEQFKYNPAINGYNKIGDFKIDKDLGRLIGYYLSEGCFTKRQKDKKYHAIVFSFNVNEEWTHVEDTIQLLKKIFNINARKYYTATNGIQVVGFGKKICEFFDKYCGHGSKEKCLSKELMNLPIEIQKEILIGEINGDGHINKDGDIHICTASELFAQQLWEICKRLKMLPTIYREERNTGYAGREGHSLSWRIDISSNSAEILGISKSNGKWNSHRRYIWNNYLVLEIKDIEVIPYKGKVYNLTITPEHSYVANNIAVANCNQWARYFYRSDPLVNNAISLHAEFPVTGFRNVCDDSSVQKFFDNLTFDVLKLPKFCSFFALEYFKLGNVIPMGIWNDEKGYWDRFITLNPDYVEIEKNIFANEPILRLDPDESLKKIIQNRAPKDIYDKLDPKVIAYIAKGMKVPLSNFVVEIQSGNGKKEDVVIPQVTHVANSTSMYEAYGLPFFFCVFKVLMYKDILRRAQFSIARRHWKPVKVVKVGDETHHATNDVLASVKDALDQASTDPNSWFIWHNYINFDYIASAGHVMPLESEYGWVSKELYAGLGVNEAILTGGGVSFANASVALRILINKYKRFQKILSDWITENVYKPVAQVQQFYRTDKETGKQELIYPRIEWEMMRLQDDAQQKNLYSQLQQKGIISKKTFLTYLGLDFEREKDLIAKEKEEDLMAAKTLEKIKNEQKVQLPNDKIKTPAIEELPGMETPEAEVGGEPKEELPSGGLPGETKAPAEGVI